ncbi:MAG: PilZ protein [Alphaproteobacteria bacterium]|nr:PilZ protein [Alphaproteobacteria bacterium]
MEFTGELSTEPGSEGRRAARAEVVLGAGLRQRGAHSVTVQIVDLSTDGFRAATHLDLFPGSDVWLKLPGLESLHGRVVWMRGHLMGCQFVRPLHPAVLDMIVRTVGGR